MHVVEVNDAKNRNETWITRLRNRMHVPPCICTKAQARRYTGQQGPQGLVYRMAREARLLSYLCASPSSPFGLCTIALSRPHTRGLFWSDSCQRNRTFSSCVFHYT